MHDERSEAVSAPKRRGRRAAVAIGVVAAVLIAAGAGFAVWHEQPGFCGAICHTPMDGYLATYEADPSGAAAGVDARGLRQDVPRLP